MLKTNDSDDSKWTYTRHWYYHKWDVSQKWIPASRNVPAQSSSWSRSPSLFPKASSSSIYRVCKQRCLCRDCADAQFCLSPSCSPSVWFYKNLSLVWGADRKLRPRVTVWHHEALQSDAFYLSAPNNHDRFFFLHTFWSPVFDFNVGASSGHSGITFLTLTSDILKSDVSMMSTPNILTTE